jgi:DNA (cytosine-5)-methyltransferase 1
MREVARIMVPHVETMIEQEQAGVVQPPLAFA